MHGFVLFEVVENATDKPLGLTADI